MGWYGGKNSFTYFPTPMPAYNPQGGLNKDSPGYGTGKYPSPEQNATNLTSYYDKASGPGISYPTPQQNWEHTMNSDWGGGLSSDTKSLQPAPDGSVRESELYGTSTPSAASVNHGSGAPNNPQGINGDGYGNGFWGHDTGGTNSTGEFSFIQVPTNKALTDTYHIPTHSDMTDAQINAELMKDATPTENPYIAPKDLLPNVPNAPGLMQPGTAPYTNGPAEGASIASLGNDQHAILPNPSTGEVGHLGVFNSGEAAQNYLSNMNQQSLGPIIGTPIPGSLPPSTTPGAPAVSVPVGSIGSSPLPPATSSPTDGSSNMGGLGGFDGIGSGVDPSDPSFNAGFAGEVGGGSFGGGDGGGMGGGFSGGG